MRPRGRRGWAGGPRAIFTEAFWGKMRLTACALSWEGQASISSRRKALLQGNILLVVRVSEEGLLIILCWDVTPNGSFGIGEGPNLKSPAALLKWSFGW